ncbi:MAG: PD-(D/E)XK nuclease family protein [Clostridia bacterium]|nr:PD-(D/E)XK nuclease family protein [Clostridia bacterium]
MLKIIKGPAGSGKSEYIFGQMRRLAEQGRRSMLIVPESISHLTERRLIETCGNAGTAHASVTTFSKLTEELLRTCGARFMDEGGRALAMYRALQSVRTGLRHYRQRTLHADFIRRLLETVSELKACLITPEQLMHAAEEGEMPDKLRDIAVIYAVYCAECERGALDPGERLDKACEYIPASGVFADAEVFVDDFSGFTAQKYRALELILQSCAGMTAALMMTEDRQLFAEQHTAVQRLRRMADRCGVQVREEELERGGELSAPAALGERFFDFSCDKYEGDCGAIEIYSAYDPDAECELAAATARRLAAENGVRLREIAVLCADMTEYAGRLENQFERYEIPLYIGEKADACAKPAVRAATGALEALHDGLSERSVFEYLKSGLFPMEAAVRDRLENYVSLWRIAGSRWHSPFTRPTTGYDAAAEDEEERLEEINAARAQVADELAALAALMAGCRTGGERARALAEHLRRTDYEGRLRDAVARLRAEGRAREAGEYAQLFNIVMGAAEQFAGVMEDVPMDAGEFLELFTLTLSQYDISTIPMSLDSVTATGFESFVPRGIKHLIVIGAREGLFPGTPAGAGLLSEPERIALETEGIELTQTAEQRAWQRFSYIYRAVSSPAERLYFIYPLRLSSGEESRCSYFVRRVPDIFPGVRAESGDALLRRLRLTARMPAFESACVSAGGGESGSAAALAHFRDRRGMADYFGALREYAAAPRGPIRDPEIIRRLYGSELRMTASRLEKVNSCRFSYFMQYGLKAAARRRGDFGAPQIGSFIHYVVENAVADVFRSGAEPEAAAKKYAREYMEKTFPRSELTGRLRANMRALSENAVFVVRNACDEINAGDFRPAYFEMSFGAGGDMPPLRIRHGEITLSVSGKIDRVDGYLHEGRLYLKVADYKTGSKSFRLSDVVYGLNLQMFLYLMLLRRGAGERLAAESGAVPEPCGALYIPAVNPFVEAPPGASPEAVQAEIDKSLRRMGLLPADRGLLDAMERPSESGYRFLPVSVKRDGEFSASSAVADAAQFGRIIDKTERILRGIAERLAAGDIEANPYRTGRDFTVCRWCDYRAACHFDENMEKDKPRYLPPLSSAEVHRMLEEEEENA